VRDGQRLSLCVKEFFHIKVEIFEDQIDFILPVNYVHQIDDARMIKFLEQRHLPDGCARNSLVRVLDLDFLECDYLL
jgi:hypothetical protein